MPHTLVTGANSFVGAHIINALLDAGHTVTGAVRRESAGQQLVALHPEWKDKVDFAVVADYSSEESWDVVFKKGSFGYIIHVAAPLLDDPANTDYDRDFLKPSVDGNLALLRSANKNAPGLKSIAVTGSINSATTGSPEELKAGPLTNETWLGISREEARAAKNAYISYCSAKKEAELAIWEFMKTASPKPHFTVTVFLPALIFGPPIQAKSVRALNYSTNIIYSFINGSNATVPATTFPSFVDVRDLATAHVRALTKPAAAGRRFLINGRPATYTALVRAMAGIPELRGRLPAESGEDANVTPADIRAEEGNSVLGMTFRTTEETMADTVARLLELEKLEQ